jgi:DNA-binding response OmpR family regulator
VAWSGDPATAKQGQPIPANLKQEKAPKVMRILLVEDETYLADIIRKGLQEEGYAVDVAYDGEEGLFLAENEPSDLIILDIMLPIVDGMTILKTIRKAGVRTPVMLLTARDAVPDKISGLDGGADDYLTKPFNFDELLARIRALLRRQSDVGTAVIEIGDLVVNMATHEVKRADRMIPLSAKEYALFEYMALNKNRVLSRTNISEHLYDYDFDLDSNIIDVFINRIRNKLDRPFGSKLIQTVRGAGYVLKG